MHRQLKEDHTHTHTHTTTGITYLVRRGVEIGQYWTPGTSIVQTREPKTNGTTVQGEGVINVWNRAAGGRNSNELHILVLILITLNLVT